MVRPVFKYARLSDELVNQRLVDVLGEYLASEYINGRRGYTHAARSAVYVPNTWTGGEAPYDVYVMLREQPDTGNLLYLPPEERPQYRILTVTFRVRMPTSPVDFLLLPIALLENTFAPDWPYDSDLKRVTFMQGGFGCVPLGVEVSVPTPHVALLYGHCDERHISVSADTVNWLNRTRVLSPAYLPVKGRSNSFTHSKVYSVSTIKLTFLTTHRIQVDPNMHVLLTPCVVNHDKHHLTPKPQITGVDMELL